MRLLAFFICGVLLGSAFVAVAQTDDPARVIRVRTNAQADSVTVGERFDIQVSATYPDSLILLPPEKIDPGTCRILSVAWDETEDEGRKTKTADFTVLTTDLDNAHLPEMPLLFLTPAGDTVEVFSDAVDVPVRALTAEQSEPMPLKPQWRPPPNFLWLYIAAAVLALAALAIFLWRRYRKRRELIVPPAPELPADFVALQELVRIEHMELLEVGDFKRYYTLVVDTLRHYLERRFGIQAMDRTTYEILWDLEGIGKPVDGLSGLLEEADLVKFAKFKPDVAAGKRAIEVARDIIVRTTPEPQPQPEPEPAGEVAEG